VTSPSPVEGPATVAAVNTSLKVTDPDDLDELALTVAAVNAVVRRWHVPRSGGEWRPDHVHGAKMLARRLWRRRNSPEGVATFTADGAVYVQRNDPDVALLLQLGQHAPPVVG
jgi:hypothetical protein